MTFGLDTTVVLRLLVGAPAEQARSAELAVRTALERGDDVLVTDLVLAEAWFALQHHYGVPKREARQRLSELLAEPGIRPEAGSSAAAAFATGSGPGPVDRLIAGRHVAEGADLWTFDERLARLDGVTRLS